MVGASASVSRNIPGSSSRQSEKLLAQTANESGLPDMELADSSSLRTPPETEPVHGLLLSADNALRGCYQGLSQCSKI